MISGNDLISILREREREREREKSKMYYKQITEEDLIYP
jgi:hypothetical protein